MHKPNTAGNVSGLRSSRLARIAMIVVSLLVATVSAFLISGLAPDSLADGGGGAGSGGSGGGNMADPDAFYVSCIWFDQGGWETSQDQYNGAAKQFQPKQGWGEDSIAYFWNLMAARSKKRTGYSARTDTNSVDWNHQTPKQVYWKAARTAIANATKRDPAAKNARVVAIAWVYMGSRSLNSWQFISGNAGGWGNATRYFYDDSGGLRGVKFSYRTVMYRKGNVPSELSADAGWNEPASIGGGNNNYSSSNQTWRDLIYERGAADVNDRNMPSVIVLAVNDHEITPATGTLKLDKVVTGVGNDANKEFKFTVNVKDGSNSVSGFPKTQMLSANGQPVEFADLPADATYEVTEESVDDDRDGQPDYTTTWSNRTGSIVSNSTVTVTATNKRTTGYAQVHKDSTETGGGGSIATHDGSTRNPQYSMAGIQYTIYKTKAQADAGTSAIQTLTLDANGDSPKSNELPSGKYYIKETKNNLTGFFSDASSHEFSIITDQTTKWQVQNNPMYGYISVTKNSAATSQAVSLAGFKYEVTPASAGIPASYKQTIVTDASGVAKTGALPLGTYTVTEVAAPEPYYLKGDRTNTGTTPDRASFTVSLLQRDNAGNLRDCVRESGSLTDTYKVPAGDTRTRNRQWGYLELVKRNEATGGIVTKDSFKWYLYQQNRNWSNARDDAHLIAIAQTNQGAAVSGTAEKGKAVFMERNGTNPKSGSVAKLPVVNTTNADEGYYEIVEVATTDPFWQNTAVYRVTIKADGNQGKTVADISLAPNTGTARTAASVFDDSGRPVASVAGKKGITVADSPDTTQRSVANTTEVQFPDAPWAYLKAIKKNTATAGTVTKKQFRFALYQQNAARSLPRTQANLIGVAVTSNGKATSGTEALGEAVFMVPNADGTPSQTPVELPVVNRLNPNEGYYDVWETDVVEPFWPTEDRYQVTISAADDNGATKADITAKSGETATTIFKNGQPISQITGEAGIKVADSPTATLRENANTTPLEIANDQYAFIEVVKKNMELANLGRDGATVAEAGFRFKLYDTLANAEAETNALEEVTTDASGKAAFKTKLSVRGTARSDPSAGSKRIHIASQTSSPTDRNDGVYYVRESYAKMPYNKSNAIYRFTISADGNEGNVSYAVDIKNPTDHNNPYTKSFASYPNGSGIAVHDSSVSGFSGAGVKNVCPTTVADAPQYGRIKITKTDSEDGSLQQGAEYQIYPAKVVDYTAAGGAYMGDGASGSQRVPTAGTDDTKGMGKEPVGYTKLSPHADGIGAGIGTYSVNEHPDVSGADEAKIRRVSNTDVAQVVHGLPAGSSTFDAATGKVTVKNPVVFTRADGTSYDTIVTDENGEATTGWLPMGQSAKTGYYLVEVRTSNGHVIDGTPIYVDLTYDSSLQDRECVVSAKDTTNNPRTSQSDRPNSVRIVKRIAETRGNPDGGTLDGVTIGMWKTEDDLQVTPDAPDGAYAFDAIAIRTPSTDVVPTVHQRVTGSEVVVAEVPEGHAIRLLDPTDTGKDADPVFWGDASGCSGTVPAGTYVVEVVSAETGEAEDLANGREIRLGEGQRVSVSATAGQESGAIAVTSESHPIEIRESNLTYDTSRDAWIATNLKAGTDYEVEFRRQVVKVIHTTPEGGHTWFGRYSEATLEWFALGWTDQAAMPVGDERLITATRTKVDGSDVFTTNTTPLTTGNLSLHTTNNHSWLQDSSKQQTYEYGTVTGELDGEHGVILNERIGAGDYVLAEIKAPVEAKSHTTYLPDTFAHHFTVDDITGYVTDTDDSRPDNLADRHDAVSHKPEQRKQFVFVDDVTKLKLSKWEMSGTTELEGAELVLTADNGDEIVRWTEEHEPHYIEGLVPGWYYLTEYATPKNYDKAETIRFNLLPTGEVQHEVMYDMPIRIGAEIDKKQEIANPLGEQDRPNGDDKNRADAQDNDDGLYSYSLDFRSTSNTWTDEFTVEDPMEPANKGYARLVSVVTPQTFQDYDGKMNVWYRTNQMPDDFIDQEYLRYMERYVDTEASDDEEADDDEEGTRKSTPDYAANATRDDGHENPWLDDDEAMWQDEDGDGRILSYEGWYLWKRNIPTAVSTKLDVADLNLPENEYITGLRFEYGRVEPGFTSRIDGWDDELLHYEHDDVAHITGLSSQSFQASEAAADAAAARMRLLTSRFTTDMSFMLEQAAARQRQQARDDYEKRLIDAEEYNARLDDMEPGTLPKFAEALEEPAYVDDASDVRMLDSALESAKSSLQAAFPLATTSLARSELLSAARFAATDLEGAVSDKTLANIREKTEAYATEIDRLPSESGGYDIDHATEELMDTFMDALDDLRQMGLSGRVMYAPAVLRMQLTEAFVPGVVMRNFAHVDAYRNGGNADADAPGLRTTLVNAENGTHAVGSEGEVTVTDTVEYSGLVPGEEYVMTGTLHVRDDDRDMGALVMDGEEVTASETFVPDAPSGTVELTFTFDASRLAGGKSAVAFERCEMSSDATFVLRHEDISDGRQTVNEDGDVDIPEDVELEGHDGDAVVQVLRRKDDYYIETTLETEDGQKILDADPSQPAKLIDHVSYHNLVPGKTYEMSGVLHVREYDAETKQPLDGGPIKGAEGRTVFTPEQPDGSVDIVITIPATEFVFRPAVAFEELREVNEWGVASDIVIAEHKDIVSDDQTIRVTRPAEDIIPLVPIIQTGDGLARFAVAAGAAAVALGAVWKARSKREDGEETEPAKPVE